MMVRALVCCSALILGLLAMLGATAQSAVVCSGPVCRSSDASRPLDLMGFMHGGAKSSGQKTAAKTGTAKTGKRRSTATRAAARSDKAPVTAALPLPQPQPTPLPTEAATAYAAEADNEVPVVTSDTLNVIDLQMLRSSSETVGSAQKADTDDGVRMASADAGEVREIAPGPSMAVVSPAKPASQGADTPRDESWIGRLWSAVGDGFVALIALVRQLFA